MKEKSVYHFIKNSTAIEGNTLTLIETNVVLEDQLAIGCKKLREMAVIQPPSSPPYEKLEVLPKGN